MSEEQPVPSTVLDFKNLGNEFFKKKDFKQASELYSKGIDLAVSEDEADTPVEPRTLAILYSNRSFCDIQMENYGSAIQDASKAIETDPNYPKGFYRRACGYVSLGKYSQALGDIKKVVKLSPKDKTARKRLKQIKKEALREQWELAIADEANDPASSTINLDEIEIEETYSGLHVPEKIDMEFIKTLLDYYKEEKKLHKKYIYQIQLQALELLKTYPNIVDVEIPENEEVTVYGDIHGQLYDLLNIFEINGIPSDTNKTIFNGDLVDRGSWSLEVIIIVLCLKIAFPDHVFIARGNHEGKSMNKVYGFEGEVKHKYNDKCMEIFSEIFCALPLCHIIDHKIFVTHGGLFSEDGVTLDQIREINRFREIPESGIMCDLLWSDPCFEYGRKPSKRGVGIQFGPDVTENFLQNNDLELVVRSHEVRQTGFSSEHNDKLITIFSAPNYCDQQGNKGAVLRFGKDRKPHFVEYKHVPHPNKRPMAYASNYGMF